MLRATKQRKLHWSTRAATNSRDARMRSCGCSVSGWLRSFAGGDVSRSFRSSSSSMSPSRRKYSAREAWQRHACCSVLAAWAMPTSTK